MKSIIIIISSALFLSNNVYAQFSYKQKDDDLLRRNLQEFSFGGETNSGEKKSIAIAAVYSLLLPGMGELYAGNYGRGKYFTIAEGALWLTLFGVDQYGRWLQKDARNFAVQHAGVSLAGKNDKYFIDIGDYQTVQEYNNELLRRRNPYQLYGEHSSEAWSWDTRINMDNFRNMRISSDEVFNNTKFVAAAIVINHVISAIDAAMLVRSYNKSLSDMGFPDIHASVIGGFTNPNGIRISISKSF